MRLFVKVWAACMAVLAFCLAAVTAIAMTVPPPDKFLF